MMDDKTFNRLWRNKRSLYVRDPENNYNQIKIGNIVNLVEKTKGIFLANSKELFVIIPVEEYFELKGIE